MNNIRYALRQLRRNSGFTIIATITLALGIGANTAIFSVFQAVVLAPLPYDHPDRLVIVCQSRPNSSRLSVSEPDFRDWQHNTRAFQQMAAFRWHDYNLTNPGAPEHVNAKQISSGLWQ